MFVYYDIRNVYLSPFAVKAPAFRRSAVPVAPHRNFAARRHEAERWIIMSKMNPTPSRTKAVSDRQAVSLHEAVGKIMRRFKLEPGMLAGSVYADLHVNDVGLLAVLVA